LFNLHINNQINKLIQKKDEKEEYLEKLEAGFNVYVNGAHKKNEKYTPRYTAHSGKQSSTNNSSASSKCFNFPLNFESLCSSRSTMTSRAASTAAVTNTSRKKWSNSSFIFKTSDGCEIKINSPNHYVPAVNNRKHNETTKTSNQSNECDYSDDFETDDDNNNNNNNDNKEKNLIETVKFSDQESDDDDGDSFPDKIDESSKKKFIFKLTRNDVKVNFVAIFFVYI